MARFRVLLLATGILHIRFSGGPERRQFTAIDVVSHTNVLGVRSQATAGTAAAFPTGGIDRMPFVVQAIRSVLSDNVPSQL